MFARETLTSQTVGAPIKLSKSPPCAEKLRQLNPGTGTNRPTLVGSYGRGILPKLRMKQNRETAPLTETSAGGRSQV